MRSVELYDFTLDEFKKYQGISGIYGLIYDNGKEKEVIYIGQSVDIQQRLRKHRNENAFQNTLNEIIREDGKTNRCKALAMYYFIDTNRDNIKFAVFEETQELEKWEEYYIKLFKPKYNYIGIDVPYSKEVRSYLNKKYNDEWAQIECSEV